MSAPAAISATVARSDRRLMLALLGIAVALFLTFSARMIGAPFGDSHDGRNAGVWAAGGRSLMDEGPVSSRLGTRSVENGVYANHPPVLYVEAALFEAVGGRSAGVARGPAWLGSVVSLGLLAALLLGAGMRPGAAGAAVALVAATPMFLVYGSMLDTPVTSLPFGIALLLVWERARRGQRVPLPVAAALAALAVLSGWQSLLVATVIGGWAGARLARRSGRRPLDLAFVGGALFGLVILAGWLLWTFGWTLSPLLEQLRVRSGGTASVSLREVLLATRRDTGAMYGAMGALAVAGLALGLADRRTRGMVAVALVVTVPYPLVFRSGAVNHDYWHYWLLLPIGLGLAVGCDAVLRRSSKPALETTLAVAATGIAVLLTGFLWLQPDAASWAVLEGRRAGAAATSQQLGPDQASAWYTGAVGKPATWLAFATRRPAVSVPVDDLAALAARYPQDRVFVGRMRCIDGAPRIDYAFERAADLPVALPTVRRCH